ncbi:hypothetical protein [Polaromonas sp. CG_23.6]|uniref:hypothetical protein n=1 Tax=Polaromonas sp. CG_23.6 TaxID=2760709 RepID=UPI002473207B|nr:hypothetical protein [Polaromonas sp. CG_23.6]MDH6185508.1 hypothetical protein [Polaromonas sp. CG_23.6]
MPSPSATLDRAHVCTDNCPTITAARIESVIRQCGEFATIGQIIGDLGVNPHTSSPAFEARIRFWLDRAGWQRVKKTIGGARVWGYVRPATLDPKPKAWKAYLKWAAQDLADPAIRANPERLSLERQVTATRLGPYMEEIVQLAWAQLQTQESALPNRPAP